MKNFVKSLNSFITGKQLGTPPTLNDIMSKVEIHHFTGETPIEKQHTHEMDTLKILHRLAGDGKRDEFFELLETIENEDKRKDFARMFGM